MTDLRVANDGYRRIEAEGGVLLGVSGKPVEICDLLVSSDA